MSSLNVIHQLMELAATYCITFISALQDTKASQGGVYAVDESRPESKKLDAICVILVVTLSSWHTDIKLSGYSDFEFVFKYLFKDRST